MRTKILSYFLSTAAALGVATTRLWAGTFTANFDDGLVPTGTSVSGSAVVEADGGVGNTGCLKLTKAVNSQTGSFLIEDLDPGVTDGVNSLTVDFKVRVGGGTTTPADGFSFCASPDLTGTWGEEGTGSGLIISFDTYDNTDGNPDNGVGEAPAIDVRLGTTTIASTLYPNTSLLETGSEFADVHIRVDEDGTLDLVYKGTIIYTNLDLVAAGFRPVPAVRYGFGGRTGGLNENHFVDNLSITTTTGPLRLAFTRQPRSLTAVAGSAITLRVQANDPTAVIQYQWSRKGPSDTDFADIPGATAASYTTPALSLADSGVQFKVVALGANNDAQSDPATITVVNLPVPAAETTFDFNDGSVPPNTAIYGTATVTPTGGVGDSGVLRLTEAVNDQNGSFIIEDQDGGAVIGSMVATFDLQLGPGTALPADGFSFNWANDLPSSTFDNGAEEGAGTGLTVSFDAYDNGGGEAPAIDIKWHGTTVASKKFTVADLSIGAFAPVVIRVDRDGTVDVAYAGELVHNNVQIGNFSGQANARFGFAARTGGANEAQYVDNIKLTTVVCTDCLLTFVRQPDDAAVLANSSATFTAEVNAPGTATYQWQRKGAGAANFANVGGATAASYTTPPLATTDHQSQFRLIVTGPLNSITSRVATVSVLNLVRPTTDLDISFDFNDGLTPPDSQLFGSAVVTATGGVGDSGVLHLNDAANDQSGAILITRQLEGGRAMDRFVAAFDARVGEGSSPPADGYSFNWATDLPAGTYGAAEEGAGTGLSISFDTYDNGGGEAPAIAIKWQGNTVTNRNVPLDVIQTAPGAFEEVLVALDPDGTVDVAYNGQVILYNVALPNFTPLANAQFGFAGRTGGLNENHWIDNIAIQTSQSVAPPLITQQPADQTLLAGAAATLSVRVSDPLVVSGYQWQQKAPGAGTFANIPGATSPDFTTPPLAVADNGIQYRALIAVTAPVVTLTSRAATITVIDIPIPPPTVSYDFNDGAVPPGAAVFGNAFVDSTGGVGDSGVIKLTVNVNSQVGSFIVNDVAAGARVCSMTASYKVLIGGGTTPPADGMSFAWAEDLADGPFGEDGAGGGLVISFDTYDNVDGNPDNGVGEAPAIEAHFRGVSLATNMVTTAFLNTGGQFADVIIRVESDGTLDVVYDNQIVFNNLKLPGYKGLTGARFGWGARTGGLNDNHWIDNVQIAVGTVCPPALSIARNGANVTVTFEGVLETATSITGPWTPLTGQGNPYTTPATGPARFFRSRTP